MNVWQRFQVELLLAQAPDVQARPLPPIDCALADLAKQPLDKITGLLLGLVQTWLFYVFIFAILLIAAVIWSTRRLRDAVIFLVSVVAIVILFPTLIGLSGVLFGPVC